MKKRIFSVLFALVLLLTLGLVTAAPVAGAAWDITYTTQGSGTSSGLSTDQAKYGGSSAKLALPANYTVTEYAHVTVEMPAGTVLNDFTAGSYWYYPAADQVDGTSYPSFYMKGTDSPGAAYPTGYMTFYLDANGDTVADVWVVQYEAFDADQGWQQDAISDSAGLFHVEGYDNSYNQGETPGTLAQVKADSVPVSGTLGQATLLSVRVETGGWPASGPYTTNALATYIDDIIINGQTCVIEPSAAVAMTSSFTAQIGISVAPTSVDFGPVTPGVASDPQSVTVTNIGNVPEDFSAGLTNISVPDVYTTGLELSTQLVSAWSALSVAPAGTAAPELILTVPTATAPGTYTATLVFWAEASP